jgi:hypothetical protein
MEPKDQKLITDFSELKWGEKVFSKTYGMGEFLRLHGPDPIVQFSDRKLRLSADVNDTQLYYLGKKKRPKNTMSGVVRGEKVSFTKMKKLMQQEVAENYVDAKLAAQVLGLKKPAFEKLCKENRVKISGFGITKRNLKKLISNKNK